MDDILDLIDSDEKPFANEEKKETPKERYTGGSNKINLWEDVDIEPKEAKREELRSVGKTYALVFNKGTDGLPPEIIEKFYEISKSLMGKGFNFRYNGDNDSSYNKILDIDIGRVESYLPWKKFNVDVTAKMAKPNEAAYHHAAYYHKGFKKLPSTVRAIISRDINVLLGESCKNPVKLLVCYSSDGAECVKDIDYKTTGNLSFSITVADMLGIPVFNIKNEGAIAKLVAFLKTLES